MNDENLKLYVNVITSTYREKVVRFLAKEDIIPTEIASDSDILPNHISKVFSELKSKGIVACTNEQYRKNRNCHLTDGPGDSKSIKIKICGYFNSKVLF